MRRRGSGCSCCVPVTGRSGRVGRSGPSAEERRVEQIVVVEQMRWSRTGKGCDDGPNQRGCGALFPIGGGSGPTRGVPSSVNRASIEVCPSKRRSKLVPAFPARRDGQGDRDAARGVPAGCSAPDRLWPSRAGAAARFFYWACAQRSCRCHQLCAPPGGREDGHDY